MSGIRLHEHPLEIVEDVILKCSGCGIPLVNIVSTKRKNEKSRVDKAAYQVVDCYKCHGKSFKSKVFSTDTSIGSLADHISAELIDTVEEKDGTTLCLIKTRRTR